MTAGGSSGARGSSGATRRRAMGQGHHRGMSSEAAAAMAFPTIPGPWLADGLAGGQLGVGGAWPSRAVGATFEVVAR